MEDIALLTDQDKEDESDFNKVTLMTVHAAKGLEFSYVYIVGVEENLFPSQLSLNTRSELEEERRLFYVALTRAKTKATLSYAVSRYKWGNFVSCEPSRFIEELDEQYLDLSLTGAVKKNNLSLNNTWSNSNQKTLSKISAKRNLKKISSIESSNIEPSNVKPTISNEIKIGVEVKHDRFGKGKVIDLSGESPNIKATVFFPSSGQKQLLLKFAKLQILN